MIVKCLSQLPKSVTGMIVADGIAGQFPDMLLGIEVGTGDWKIEHVQTGMLFNKFPRHTRMPTGPIP